MAEGLTWTERAIAALRAIAEEAEREAAVAWARRDRVMWNVQTERHERADAALKRLDVRAAQRAPSLADMRALCDRLRAEKDAALIPTERRLVLLALRATNGHRERAIAASGLSRRTFYRRMGELHPADIPPAPVVPPSPEWTLPSEDVILTALAAHDGNRSAACRALGLHPQALQGWAAKRRSRSAK